MDFPQRLRVKKQSLGNSGIKNLKKSLAVIGKFVCLTVGAVAAFTALQIFYPDNTELKLPYILFAISIGILGLFWLRSVSTNTFLLLAYFSGVFIFCQLVKLAFKGAGSDLPEWRWFFLSLFYGVFLWIAHNLSRYQKEPSP